MRQDGVMENYLLLIRQALFDEDQELALQYVEDALGRLGVSDDGVEE